VTENSLCVRSVSALSDSERIQEIAVWFDEHGYELLWHEHAG